MPKCDFCGQEKDDIHRIIDGIDARLAGRETIKFSEKVLPLFFSQRMLWELHQICVKCVRYIVNFYLFHDDIRVRLDIRDDDQIEERIEDLPVEMMPLEDDDLPPTSTEIDPEPAASKVVNPPVNNGTTSTTTDTETQQVSVSDANVDIPAPVVEPTVVSESTPETVEPSTSSTTNPDSVIRSSVTEPKVHPVPSSSKESSTHSDIRQALALCAQIDAATQQTPKVLRVLPTLPTQQTPKILPTLPVTAANNSLSQRGIASTGLRHLLLTSAKWNTPLIGRFVPLKTKINEVLDPARSRQAFERVVELSSNSTGTFSTSTAAETPTEPPVKVEKEPTTSKSNEIPEIPTPTNYSTSPEYEMESPTHAPSTSNSIQVKKEDVFKWNKPEAYPSMQTPCVPSIETLSTEESRSISGLSEAEMGEIASMVKTENVQEQSPSPSPPIDLSLANPYADYLGSNSNSPTAPIKRSSSFLSVEILTPLNSSYETVPSAFQNEASTSTCSSLNSNVLNERINDPKLTTASSTPILSKQSDICTSSSPNPTSSYLTSYLSYLELTPHIKDTKNKPKVISVETIPNTQENLLPTVVKRTNQSKDADTDQQQDQDTVEPPSSVDANNNSGSESSSIRPGPRKCKKEPVFNDFDSDTSLSLSTLSTTSSQRSSNRKRKCASQAGPSNGKKKSKHSSYFEKILDKSIEKGGCIRCNKKPSDYNSMRSHLISKHRILPAVKLEASSASTSRASSVVDEVKDEPVTDPAEIENPLPQPENTQSSQSKQPILHIK